MAAYSFTFTVPRPVPDVFEYLCRFSNALEWDPGVLAADELTPGPVHVGSRFSLVVRFAGRPVPMEYEVRELVPSTRVVLEARNVLVRSRDSIEVSDVGEPGAPACRVRYVATLSGRGPGMVLGPALALALRKAGGNARAGLSARLSGPVAFK